MTWAFCITSREAMLKEVMLSMTLLSPMMENIMKTVRQILGICLELSLSSGKEMRERNGKEMRDKETQGYTRNLVNVLIAPITFE